MKSAVTFGDDNAGRSGANRRHFLMQAGTSAGILAAGMVLNAASTAEAAAATRGGRTRPSKSQPSKGPSPAFWPDGIKMAISISMQFEAGGQPPKGTDSPFPKVDFPPEVPADAAANTWFAYGYREGIPRMLDLWDRHGVKVTCHMIGEAAQHHPELAKEIVARGHEASGHGPRWSSQYAMSREEERQFLIAARDMVEVATGQRPVGYSCNWLRRGPNTLSLLQELGYLYHIDDVSRDEPFIEQVNSKDFVVVPYTLRNNDILLASIGTTTLLGGVQRLAERAGPSRAREIIYTADQYDAATFERWNIVNRIVPDDALEAETRTFAARLANGPTLAYAAGKLIVRAYLDGSVRAADKVVDEVGPTLFESADMQAGVTALLDHGPRGFRDKVVFEGR